MTNLLSRVEWIYSNYQDAVESDQCLLAIYANYFGVITHQQVSSIKRAGRHWRFTSPHKYMRSKQKIRQDKIAEQKIKEVLA